LFTFSFTILYGKQACGLHEIIIHREQEKKADNAASLNPDDFIPVRV